MSVAAIITAGGLGTRMQSNQPKQFMELDGKSILEHTISIFQASNIIQEIIVVVPCAFMNKINLSEVKVVEGGLTRQESVYNGLCAIDTNPNIVVIHDGVRCLLQTNDLQNVIEACKKPFDGSVLAHPVRDTLKKVKNETIQETVDRVTLWAMQTPQVFFFDNIKKAYEKVRKDGVQTTDDAQVMEHAGGKVKIVQGPMTNIKVTYPEDLSWVESMMENQK